MTRESAETMNLGYMLIHNNLLREDGSVDTDVILSLVNTWLAHNYTVVSGDFTEARFYSALEIITAADRWYDALVRLGHYSAEDLARDHSPFRSDRWPPEVRLAAAVERLRERQGRSITHK